MGRDGTSAGEKEKIMNAKQTNQHYSIVDFLATRGILPASVKGSDQWYRSMIREEEKTASFKVDSKKNLWFDHGLGKGGNLVDLACILFETTDIRQVLKEIENGLFSFHPQKTEAETLASKCDGLRFIGKGIIQDSRLVSYLVSRGISLEVANQFCVELCYENEGRLFRSVAFENISHGYELSGQGFKSCLIPKDISMLESGGVNLCVFEGFMDFLSYQMLPIFRIDKSDVLVLNTLSLLGRALEWVTKYDRIFLFLDNDNAGRNAVRRVKAARSQVIDVSIFYAEHKDLNEYLIQTATHPLVTREQHGSNTRLTRQ